MMSKINDSESDKMTVEERLPDIIGENYENAVGHKALSWAHGFMQDHCVGQTAWLGEWGLQLQKISENVVRCVAVVDHPFSLGSLAMTKLTFETADIKLEVSPYTVVIPYVEKKDNLEGRSQAGLEVA